MCGEFEDTWIKVVYRHANVQIKWSAVAEVTVNYKKTRNVKHFLTMLNCPKIIFRKFIFVLEIPNYFKSTYDTITNNFKNIFTFFHNVEETSNTTFMIYCKK